MPGPSPFTVLDALHTTFVQSLPAVPRAPGHWDRSQRVAGLSPRPARPTTEGTSLPTAGPDRGGAPLRRDGSQARQRRHRRSPLRIGSRSGSWRISRSSTLAQFLDDPYPRALEAGVAKRAPAGHATPRAAQAAAVTTIRPAGRRRSHSRRRRSRCSGSRPATNAPAGPGPFENGSHHAAKVGCSIVAYRTAGTTSTKACRDEQLDEVAFACSRQAGLVPDARLDHARGVPEHGQRSAIARVVPHAGSDHAVTSCHPSHLGEACDGSAMKWTTSWASATSNVPSSNGSRSADPWRMSIAGNRFRIAETKDADGSSAATAP